LKGIDHDKKMAELEAMKKQLKEEMLKSSVASSGTTTSKKLEGNILPILSIYILTIEIKKEKEKLEKEIKSIDTASLVFERDAAEVNLGIIFLFQLEHCPPATVWPRYLLFDGLHWFHVFLDCTSKGK
jgi:hypothetical protein